ncbi:MAG: SDR family NAD(P)-dependent oxidoreductase, partial [Pseudomonadota bacterium]
GDRVHALIKGTAVNHDGRAAGLTAPSRTAQIEVVRAALHDARITADDLGAVEAHGTGTPLGDSVEAEALSALSRTAPLPLCSAKAVLGHLEHAAGMASLIKAALVLKHRTLPAQPEFGAPNPLIDFERLGLSPAATTDGVDGAVGVSGFGISGTNAHVILGAAPAVSAPPEEDSPAVLVVSAPTEAALKDQARALSETLADAPCSLPSLAHQLAARRPALGVRAAVTAQNRHETVQRLSTLAQSANTAARAQPARPVFVFAGQGAQWPSMGAALLDDPTFAASIEELETAFGTRLRQRVKTLIADPDASLGGPLAVQPALFAMQVALAKLWQNAGVEPAAVLGHSMGEFAASVVAGVLPLEEAAAALTERARLVEELASGHGAMALTDLASGEAPGRLAAIDPALSLAVENAPDATVVAGPRDAVASLVKVLSAEGRFVREVDVDYASHTPLMHPLVAKVAAALAGLSGTSGRVPFVSSATGAFMDGVAFTAAYAAEALAKPVRFSAAVDVLVAESFGPFIEVGPHPVLKPSIESSARNRPARAIATLSRGAGTPTDLRTAFASAWAEGVSVAPSAIAAPRPFAELPGYVFAGPRLWLSQAPSGPQSRPVYAITWNEAPPTTEGEASPTAERDVPAVTLVCENAEEAAVFTPVLPGAVGEGRNIVLLPPLASASEAIKAIREELIASPASLTVVTERGTAAHDGSLNASAAAAIAFSLTAAADAGIDVRVIDCADRQADAGAVVEELSRPAERMPVALSAGRRLRPVLGEASLAATPIALEGHGAHVVTGGLSGVGLETAVALADGGAAAIALIGRRPAPSEGDVAERIGALRERVNLTTHQGDVTDNASLAAALEEIRKTHGAILSVSHAAGVSDRTALEELTEDAIEAVLGAKLRGAQKIVALTQDDDLRFVLFHSSIAALFRSPGQAAYAAANAGLDALAHTLREAGRRAISVAWPVWREVGAAARAGFTADTAFHAIDPAKGRAAIQEVITLSAAHVVAAKPNFEPAMATVLADAPFALSEAIFDEVRAALPTAPTPCAGGTGPLGRAEGHYSATERILVRAYGNVLGLAGVDVTAAFFSLGGNSIHAARIVNALRADAPALGVTIVDILSHQTIEELAAILDGRDAVAADGPIPRAEPADDYPASAEQRRFWFEHATAPDPSVFNLTSAYLVPGLDRAALDAALAALIARHEPLRTTLHMTDGGLRQKILPAPPSILEELAGSGPAKARVHAVANRAFDLASERPFRAILMDADEGPVLVLSIHHVAGDGWGLGTFADELDVLYRTKTRGEPHALPSLPITYKDYAVWQGARHRAPDVAAALDRWTAILAPPLPELSLPTDRPRPETRSGRGKTASFTLSSG